MDAEHLRTTADAGDDAGEGAGVASEGIGLVEDLADDGLAGDGQEDGALKAVESGELAVDAEVVIALFGEVDAGVEDEVLGAETGVEGELDFLLEEGVEGGEDVRIGDVGVGDLGLADAVHDEKAGAVLSAEAGVGVVGEGADVIDEVAAFGEDLADDVAAPGIDGKHGGPGLVGVPAGPVEALDEAGEGAEEGGEAVHFLGDGDGAAVGAGAFGADVDDVRAVAELLLRLSQGGGGVQGAVAAEGIVIDVDDAHDEGASGKSEGVVAGAPEHGRTYAGGQARKTEDCGSAGRLERGRFWIGFRSRSTSV